MRTAKSENNQNKNLKKIMRTVESKMRNVESKMRIVESERIMRNVEN